MSESLTTRKSRKRPRRHQVERPTLQLPVADGFRRLERDVETKPGDSVAAPERGIAQIDFFI